MAAPIPTSHSLPLSSSRSTHTGPRRPSHPPHPLGNDRFLLLFDRVSSTASISSSLTQPLGMDGWRQSPTEPSLPGPPFPGCPWLWGFHIPRDRRFPCATRSRPLALGRAKLGARDVHVVQEVVLFLSPGSCAEEAVPEAALNSSYQPFPRQPAPILASELMPIHCSGLLWPVEWVPLCSAAVSDGANVAEGMLLEFCLKQPPEQGPEQQQPMPVPWVMLQHGASSTWHHESAKTSPAERCSRQERLLRPGLSLLFLMAPSCTEPPPPAAGSTWLWLQHRLSLCGCGLGLCSVCGAAEDPGHHKCQPWGHGHGQQCPEELHWAQRGPLLEAASEVPPCLESPGMQEPSDPYQGLCIPV